MDASAARQHIALHDRVKDLEDQLKEAKAERDASEAQLLDDLATDGINSLHIDGRCLYIRTDTYATTPAGKDAAVELLADSEHADIVKPTVNSNTLGALVRELLQDGGELPPEWAGIIGVGERYSVGVRKAG